MVLALYGETTRVITNFLFFNSFNLHHYPRKKGCKSSIILMLFKQLTRCSNKLSGQGIIFTKILSPF